MGGWEWLPKEKPRLCHSFSDHFLAPVNGVRPLALPCRVPHLLPHLLRAPLDAAVLAGHVLAVPVVSSSTCQTQVGVALADGQVAGALLGVALCFAAAARKAVLTCRDSHRRGLMEPSQQPPYPAAQMRRNFLCIQTSCAASVNNEYHHPYDKFVYSENCTTPTLTISGSQKVSG